MHSHSPRPLPLLNPSILRPLRLKRNNSTIDSLKIRSTPIPLIAQRLKPLFQHVMTARARCALDTNLRIFPGRVCRSLFRTYCGRHRSKQKQKVLVFAIIAD